MMERAPFFRYGRRRVNTDVGDRVNENGSTFTPTGAGMPAAAVRARGAVNLLHLRPYDLTLFERCRSTLPAGGAVEALLRPLFTWQPICGTSLDG